MLKSSLSPSASLCLACSSSLPPRTSSNDVFLTPCCSRPICPSCLSSNPRLARYNPCLRCLGGVGVIQGGKRGESSSSAKAESYSSSVLNGAGEVNLDGGVHDADVYAIGDDEDDEDEDDEQRPSSAAAYAVSPNALPGSSQASSAEIIYANPWREGSSGSTAPSERIEKPQPEAEQEPETQATSVAVPSKYYIEPGDTLHSVSLRFKIDPQIICRLNNLPLSTLRSTPHLLHTRTFLTLPGSSTSSSPSPSKIDPERETRRRREVAESRFRNVTKETDWDVARAYVALAEQNLDTDADDDSAAALEGKEYGREKMVARVEEGGGGDDNGAPRPDGVSMEERAVDRYMDDDEWEERERREGRGVSIPRFPLFGGTMGSGSANTSGEKLKARQWTVPTWMRWTSEA